MIPLIAYFVVIGALFLAAIVSPAITFAGLVLIKLIDFWGQLAHPFFYHNPRLTNILIVAALMVAIASRLIRTRIAKPQALNVWSLVLGLWCYAFLSLSWSRAPSEGYEQWTLYYPYMVITLLIPLLFTRTDEFEKSFVATTVIGGSLSTLILVYGSWSNRTISLLYDSVDGLWDPLAFGQAAGFVVIMGALSRFEHGRLWSLLRWAPVAAGVVLAARSGSRGQFLLMLLVPMLFVWGFRFRSKILLVSIAILSIALIGAVGFVALEQVAGEERWSTQRFEADAQLRIDMISRVLSVWRNDSGAILVGLGNSSSFAPSVLGFYPHVVPLEVLAELGIIGFLALVAIICLTCWNFWRSLKLTGSSPRERASCLILGGCFAYTFVLSFKQGSLASFSPIVFLYAILIERYLNLRAIALKSEARPPQKPLHHSAEISRSGRAGTNRWPNLLSR